MSVTGYMHLPTDALAMNRKTLSILESDGLIQGKKEGSAIKRYLMTERFFNIWYLMRHGTRRNKSRMKWLVSFLTSFYSANELQGLWGQFLDVEEPNESYALALREAVLESHFSRENLAGLKNFQGRHAALETLLSQRKYNDVIKEAKLILDDAKSELGDHAVLAMSYAQIALSTAHYELKNFEESIRYAMAYIDGHRYIDSFEEQRTVFKLYTRIIECYISLKKPSLVVEAAEKLAIQISKSSFDLSEEDSIFTLFYKFHAESRLNRFDEAISTAHYIIDAIGTPKSDVMKTMLRVVSVWLSTRYLMKGDTIASLSYWETAKVAGSKDKEFEIQPNKDLVEAILRFDLKFEFAFSKKALDSLADAADDKSLQVQIDYTRIWLLLFTKSVQIPETTLSKVQKAGQHVLCAGVELAQENFGLAMKHLETAIEKNQNIFQPPVFAFERFIRLTKRKGYGDRLIDWMERSTFAAKHEPIYIAARAFLQDESVLFDVNPEVRLPAEQIFERLSEHRKWVKA